MEKRIDAGKYYMLILITGRVIKGKLIEWNGRYGRLKMLEFSSGKTLEMERLSEQEFASLKEIRRDGTEPRSRNRLLRAPL